MNDRIDNLVVVAHPDDEILGLAALVLSWCLVVNLFCPLFFVGT